MIDEFFEINNQHSNLHVLFYLYQNQIISAVAAADQSKALDSFTASILQSKIRELPVLERNQLEAGLSPLLAQKLRSFNEHDSQLLMSPSNRLQDDHSSQEIHKRLTTSLNRSNSMMAKSKNSRSFAEILEEERKRDYHEDSLGLLLSESRRNISLTEQKDIQNLEVEEEEQEIISKLHLTLMYSSIDCFSEEKSHVAVNMTTSGRGTSEGILEELKEEETVIKTPSTSTRKVLHSMMFASNA